MRRKLWPATVIAAVLLVAVAGSALAAASWWQIQVQVDGIWRMAPQQLIHEGYWPSGPDDWPVIRFYFSASEANTDLGIARSVNPMLAFKKVKV